MSEKITLDKIKNSLFYFESNYDAVRLVDPLQKRVLDCKKNGKSDLERNILLDWEKEVITDDSIAVRAYSEKKSFFTLKQKPNGFVMIAAIPLMSKIQPLTVEYLFNAANVQIVGVPMSDNAGDLAQDILSDANGIGNQDSLTGLYNRHYIDERLPRDINEANASKAPLSVIFVDVDNLKTINDTLGHIAGDLALKEIGGAIQRNIRLNADWAARYGGDEFFISLPNTAYDRAYQIAERIRKEVEIITISVPEGSIRLSISQGVHTLSGSKLAADELIRLADRKMYHAKKSGKNRTVGNGFDIYNNETKLLSTCPTELNNFYDPAMNTSEEEQKRVSVRGR
jgi:two-component system cell cycle response regulator